MAFLLTMHFYVTKTPDGLYHVQNYVGIHKGQHHVHNEASYQKWKAQLSESELEHLHLSEGKCNCGLTESGQTREYDGHEWFNDTFEG